MSRFHVTFILSTLFLASICFAQQPATTSVPNLIRYGGALKDAQDLPLVSATTGVTFAIYKLQDGGAPMWMETQNVTTDTNGNYNVLLGSTAATGLPGDLFSQQEQRWLGVQVQGQAEQARVLLVSVPYAFKAHEAETLGGLPASAFVKAPSMETSSDGLNGTALSALSNVTITGGSSTTKGKTASGKPNVSAPCSTIGGGGTLNFIPLWTPDGCTLGNSLLSQLTAGRVDVNGNFNLASTTSAYQIGANNVLSIGSSNYNLFLGVGAGAHNVAGSGRDNTFSGYRAGYQNTFGSHNTFSGFQAGGSNTTGQANTFSGLSAGYSNTSGSENVFVGDLAGYSNTSANGNTFTGASAGYGNTTGEGNTFTGGQAGYSNTTGYLNAFFGQGAGASNTTGSDNTFLGMQAGYYNTTGRQNTFVGWGAGMSNTGENNIFLGFQTGYSNGTGSSDIYIGNSGGAESNTLRIGTQGTGDGQQSVTYIAGIYGSTSASGIPVYINSNGQLGTQTSSLRFKEQVHAMGDQTAGLMKLRPVTFFYKPEYEKGQRTLQYGLIAEEVAQVYPELVAYDNDGQPYSVRYQYLSTMLLNEVQKQYRRAEEQAQIIKAQEQEIESLKQQLSVQNTAVQARLSRLEKLIPQTVAQQ